MKIREVVMPIETPTRRKIIDSKEVDERVPKSRVQRWRDIKAGKFPAPIEVGPNKLGWFEDEIDSWMAARPRRRYREREGPAE
jgi:prophage regulatory protein